MQRPTRKVLATGAVLALGGTLVAGVGFEALQMNEAKAAAAEAAQDYTPAVTYTAPPQPTKVAFLGDSFTAGAGAESPYNRWSTLVSNENRWLELNYGKSGTNYGTAARRTVGEAYADRLTDLIISRPDIVIVSTAGTRLDEDQEPGIRETFHTLREKLPDAQIIATSPYYGADEMPSAFEEFGEDIEREVEAIDGEYLDVGHPLLGRRDAENDEGIPNDAGYVLLADAIGDALDDAGVTGAETAN